MAKQEGEWNQVRRKGGRLRHIPSPADGLADSVLPDGIRPNPTPELSIDDLWRYHQTVSQDGEMAEWWQHVRGVLDDASNSTNPPVVITTAVCLGPGPYEPSNGSSKARRTAHMQTAAFCAIIDYLRSRSGHQDIRCVVQEPRFTEVDKAFCARLGLEVLESPDAFALVDEKTLLFGIHLELEIYNRALAATLPGIYVGVPLEQWEMVVKHDAGSEGTGCTTLAAFAKMEAGYAKYAFPDVDYMFSSTVMYWRGEHT
ncbi:uncharacterized protein B0T15DRAFT_571490 [Chaetomium strumarium]|uniref:SRR1-like domain-containing protein n=1 Tax=Chaetomium strumarium TaxID=1170767 RepID=A0AAJ0H3A0_9PEZI|nr:hypothetical protein B0T15DRAFT_571490 [Chaetomium strumarium]